MTDTMTAKYKVAITANIVWLIFEPGMKPEPASEMDLCLMCNCLCSQRTQ